MSEGAPFGKPRSAIVIGYGLSGKASTRWLCRRGWEVTVIEDEPSHLGDHALDDLPAKLLLAPSPDVAGALASRADLVVPSPGVPTRHPALQAAAGAGVQICSEIELGWRGIEESRRGGVPWCLVAITGTNGKTTVTRLVTAMLQGAPDRSSQRRIFAAGNLGYPLVEAVEAVEQGPAQSAGKAAPVCAVAEVSSFQLHYTQRFSPDVSCWLNFSADHLDWHPDLAHYASAKARIWANQGPGCSAVVNASDGAVVDMARAAPDGVKVVKFGHAGSGADWRVYPDRIEGPNGVLLNARQLPRALPHDLDNTAAALAVAIEAGGDVDACIEAAYSLPAPPHRVELVVQGGGMAWYDDSKATTPASVQAAVSGFSSVVLIAGGRNKGLDLSVLRSTVPPVRVVVAIGESAAEITSAFAGLVPVLQATSMEQAVDLAAREARRGDAVVLSPGCASFDWYSSYVERGDHFAALAKKAMTRERQV